MSEDVAHSALLQNIQRFKAAVPLTAIAIVGTAGWEAEGEILGAPFDRRQLAVNILIAGGWNECCPYHGLLFPGETLRFTGTSRSITGCKSLALGRITSQI